MPSESLSDHISTTKRSRDDGLKLLENVLNRVSSSKVEDQREDCTKRQRRTGPLLNSFSSKQLANLRNVTDKAQTEVQTITSAAHHVHKGENRNHEESPVAFLKSILRDETQQKNHKFVKPTKEELLAYNHEVVQAVRTRNMDKLKQLHSSGQSLRCCNRFGESLIHMACRRGYEDIATFLIEEAGVSIRIQDDFGRTPMHDACWTSDPNFELMDMLIRQDPGLLLVSDVRGHTPFDYARREHWGQWVSFLTKRKQLFHEKVVN